MQDRVEAAWQMWWNEVATLFENGVGREAEKSGKDAFQALKKEEAAQIKSAEMQFATEVVAVAPEVVATAPSRLSSRAAVFEFVPEWQDVAGVVAGVVLPPPATAPTFQLHHQIDCTPAAPAGLADIACQPQAQAQEVFPAHFTSPAFPQCYYKRETTCELKTEVRIQVLDKPRHGHGSCTTIASCPLRGDDCARAP